MNPGNRETPYVSRRARQLASRRTNQHGKVRRTASFVYRHGLRSRKRLITTAVLLLIVPIVLVQLLYPGGLVLPNTTVGAVEIGGKSKEKAAQVLDEAYAHTKVPVYFSDSDEVVIQPKLGELGVSTDNTQRVEAYDYPFIARLLPYSLFWYHAFVNKGEPTMTRDETVLDRYITERFGADCEFEPVNATIAYRDEALQVIDATRGGSCDPAELRTKLAGVSARLVPERVTIEGTSTAPEVSTKTAQTEYTRLIKEMGDHVNLKVEDKTEKIPTKTVSQWIAYSVVDGKLTLGLNDTASSWLSDKYAKAFTSPAGVTTITVKDYATSAEDKGVDGKALNTGATATEIIKDLNGEQDSATLVVDTIKPAIEYKRTYSEPNAALSAVMKKYADTHSGVYGVKMVELSGKRRNAEYNAARSFTTASTYKLFVAYSTLLRIEKGELSWNDTSYGGLSVSTCFDKMIKLSNNECAVWLLLHAGQPEVTAEAQAIGLKDTSFLGRNGIKSTAADEAHFLAQLYTGQILTQQASRDRLIEAMKGNVYVAGIPSGIPDATIANKVGFLDGLLHDASIVYSKKGDYVLIILTDNASWGNIAELAKEIEAAR